jgi:hypothetical protein
MPAATATAWFSGRTAGICDGRARKPRVGLGQLSVVDAPNGIARGQRENG